MSRVAACPTLGTRHAPVTELRSRRCVFFAAEDRVSSSSRPLVFTLEMLGFGACGLVGLSALTHVLRVDFPAKNQALVVLVLGTLASAFAAGVAASRGPTGPTRRALGWMRLVVGVPLMLLWLLAATAGFSA